QDLVGIVRREDEMLRALERLSELKRRAGKGRGAGNREYKPGWHTAPDLHKFLTLPQAVTPAGPAPKGRPGRHLPGPFPGQGRGLRQGQPGGAKGARRADAAGAGADPGDAGGTETDHRRKQVR